MMIKEKQCTRCKRILPLTDFHKHKPSSDGRKPRCKRCRCELQKEYVLENPEKKRESDRQYYYNNKEQIARRGKRYRIKNKDQIKAKHAKYRAENSERLKDWFKEFYQKNRERKLKQVKQYANQNEQKISQYQKRYRKQNSKQLKRYHKQFREENRKRYKLYGLNYLARKNKAEGEYTLEQWKELCSFFKNICPCCKRKVSSFEADHITPLTWDDTSNYITNIQPLCRSCNGRKCNYHDTDYRPDHVKQWARGQISS